MFPKLLFLERSLELKGGTGGHRGGKDAFIWLPSPGCELWHEALASPPSTQILGPEGPSRAPVSK